jgi:hypothetical protein
MQKITPTFLSWVDSGNNAQSLYFDLIIQDTSIQESEITDHPVEEGANVSDHVRRTPDHFSAQVMVTNQPIDDLPDGSRKKVVTKGETGAMVATFDDNDNISDTYSHLQALHDAHRLLTITTPLSQYSDYLITKLEVTRDKENSGGIVKIDIDFRQILIVRSDLVSSATIPEAQPIVSKGQGEPETPENGDQSSVLYRATHGDESDE